MNAGLIASISVIAAFFGGMVALFAPCCITFLLPSYLANVFKNKGRVLGMTLIFGGGIATILVPTALGIRAIGEIFQSLHTQTYFIGGLFMIFLALMEFSGRKITLPMINLTIDLNRRHDPWSVYLLGLFSGITSSCCTPVLAGILTLSFLSPSFFWAGLSGLSYVAGMVTPLVLISLFLEKINWSALPLLRRKTVSLLGKSLPLTDAAAGVIFLSMGFLFIYFAATDRIVMGSQKPLEATSFGLTLTSIVRFLRSLPASEFVFAVLLTTITIYLVKKVLKT